MNLYRCSIRDMDNQVMQVRAGTRLMDYPELLGHVLCLDDGNAVLPVALFPTDRFWSGSNWVVVKGKAS
jgi:hypothetical protein